MSCRNSGSDRRGVVAEELSVRLFHRDNGALRQPYSGDGQG
jgi:hypothetical protein